MPLGNRRGPRLLGAPYHIAPPKLGSGGKSTVVLRVVVIPHLVRSGLLRVLAQVPLQRRTYYRT